MSLNRAASFRSWVEWFTWSGIIVLVVLLFVLPFPETRRVPVLLFLLAVAGYLVFVFRFLFPRTQYSPRVIYITLFLNILIVGGLCLWLADYLPDFDIALIPLIGVAATVSSRRGTLVLALFAALMDLLINVELWLARPNISMSLLIMNQLAMAAGLVITGLVLFSLMDAIRRHSQEAEQAALRVADLERRHRSSFEHALQRFQQMNAVGLRVQHELQPEAIYRVLADEIKPLGYDFLIALWEEPEQTLQLEYVSLSASVLTNLQALTGISQPAFNMDVRHLAPYQEAMAQRQAVLSQAPGDLLRRVSSLSANQVERILNLLGSQKLIVAPMFAGEHVIGFFHVWGPELGNEDAPGITGLAQQIALALEKARLLQREQRRVTQLALVNEIAGRAVGLMGPVEALKELTRLIVQRFGFENASILLNDARAREVVLRAHYGRSINFELIGYRQSWDVGLIGEAARTGETIVANDVTSDGRYFTAFPDKDICLAELSIPLKRGDQILGVLDIQSTRRGAFGVDDVTALETLGNLLAAILEKGELFAAERKRAAQMALVSAIAERITAILDPNQLLNEVAKLIRERFGYYNVTLLTLQPEGEQLRLRAVSGGYADLFPPDYVQLITVGLFGAAARTGSTTVVPDVTRDERFYFPPGEQAVTGSEMSVPIKIGRRVLGVLDIQTCDVNAFDASDVAAMETLANQVAVALENARLYAQTRDEAEIKTALLRELSHRVKNNLTAVVGLLSLGLDDETISRDQILNETLMRVQSMAVAHTLLANSPRARVDVMELSRRVIGDSIRQMTLPGRPILFEVRGDSLEISAQQATSLALVLNELVTNAIKHGGAEISPGLSLCIQSDQSQVRLEFSNLVSNGAASSSEWISDGVGLRLIRTLVEKDLGGRLTFTPQGTTFFSTIWFTPQT